MNGHVQHNLGAGEHSPAPCLCNHAARQDEPSLRLTLWPNRSLGPQGQRIVILLVIAGLALPVMALVLQGVGLIVLGFAIVVTLAMIRAFRVNTKAGAMYETVTLWPDALSITRYDPDKAPRHWCADPMQVRLRLDPNGKPENYLTLTGAGRRIELGAFLTPEERASLYDDLDHALRFAGIQR